MSLTPFAAVERPDVLHPGGDGARILGQEIAFQLIAGGLVLLLVLGLLVAIVVRNVRRAGTAPGDPLPDPETDDQEGRAWIVLGGLALPLVVLSAVVGFTIRSFLDVDDAGGRVTQRIEVIGHRWWWEVRYPGESVTTANEVVLPVGQPVRLRLRTKDVIHSLWIPQLDRKADMIPGRITFLRFVAEHPGEYRGECAEFCGLQHAHMGFRVRAVSPGAFRAWIAHEREPAQAPETASEQAGRRLFLTRGCAACHTIAGTPAKGWVGPHLTHVAARPTLAAGTLPNTTASLTRWIADPQHVKQGVAMPRIPLSADERRDVVAYLRSLR